MLVDEKGEGQSMLGRLIRKEILEHLMSLRFAIACSLCLLVVLSSLFVRIQDYNQAVDDYETRTRMEDRRLATMDHPSALTFGGTTVFTRPNPLKIFVHGVNDSYAEAFQIKRAWEIEPASRSVFNVGGYLFPTMDLMAFAGLILSLMAVVFGYDAISGEKERGTLRLMLSYAVPRDKVLLSKWIGGYLALIVPFLLTVVVGAVLVTIQPTVSLTAGQWVRLAAIVGLALLYVASVYSMAILVSCLTPRPSTSVMVLLSLWVVLVLALPNLSPHVAAMVVPAGNPREVKSQIEPTVREVFHREFREPWTEYQASHANGSEQDQTEQHIQMMTLFKRATRSCLEAAQKIHRKADSAVRTQTMLSRWLGRVSPMTCFAAAAAELADEGATGRWRYRDQLWSYQRELMDYTADEEIALLEAGVEVGRDPASSWRLVRTKPTPRFAYVPPAGVDVLGAIAVDAGILTGLTLALFLLSHTSFLRYDVR